MNTDRSAPVDTTADGFATGKTMLPSTPRHQPGISVIIPVTEGVDKLDRVLSGFMEANSYFPVELIILGTDSAREIDGVVKPWSARTLIRYLELSSAAVSRAGDVLARSLFAAAVELGVAKPEYPYFLLLGPATIYANDMLGRALGEMTHRGNGAAGIHVTPFLTGEALRRSRPAMIHRGDLEKILRDSPGEPGELLLLKEPVLDALFSRPSTGERRLTPVDRFFEKAWKFVRRLRSHSAVSTGSAKKPPQGKKQQVEINVKRLRLKMQVLGFDEKASEELLELALRGDPLERKLAARELAPWYADQYSRASAEQCLQMVAIGTSDEVDPVMLRQGAILRAECLDLLDRRDEARRIIGEAIEREEHSDLYCALSNLCEAGMVEGSSPPDLSIASSRLSLVNTVLSCHGLEGLSLREGSVDLSLDTIEVSPVRIQGSSGGSVDGPLVTVIMPAYNAEEHISTALRSLLAQTWRNLEILVVDDASTDGTPSLIETFARSDSRVRLIRNPVNGGPYVARNLALREARGDFVTCHDTDDWSHPRKIEIQARYLLDHSSAVATLSEQARVLTSMIFFRRGNPGFYRAPNFSSLMFRRQPVLDRCGYWDSVRFAGDSEYVKRLRRLFGSPSIVFLQTGPLSFVRQGEASLTGTGHFGYHGFPMGARRAYVEAHTWWHQREPNPRLDFPLSRRPFPIPAPMDPLSGKTDPRRLDVVIATELRLTGGTITSTIEEIKAHQALGLRTGLVQMSRFDLNLAPYNAKILELIDGDSVQLLVYGEEIHCDLLIIRHPPVLQEYQKYLPSIRAGRVVVVVNQAPFRDYGDPDSRLYDLASCSRNARRIFGSSGRWYPIGPAVRQSLLQERNVDTEIDLADEDWHNIIDVEQWRVSRPPPGDRRPVIGRHSRDQYVKWPSDRASLLAAYPDDGAFEVQILGGAETPRKMLGHIPSNWTVYPFDSLSPQEFLSRIDLFVYFCHPDLVEAFGRTPLEAMAAGIPVILPEKFRPLFHDGALYATPFEVPSLVMTLWKDHHFYRARSEAGRTFVRQNFGYERHYRRVRTE